MSEMSERKHTPGPWRVLIDDTGDQFSGWPSVCSAPELDTIVVHRAGFKQEYWGDLSLRETLANARLIAAAPELLEALKLAREELRLIRMKDCATTYHPGLDVQISLTIAKAEGRQP